MVPASRIVSIVVPCFNERPAIAHLGSVLERLSDRLRESCEMETLFVDDGSTDGTAEALEAIAPRVGGRILRHDRNRGIAEAFRTGFGSARGDVVCTIDADCTFDPDEIVPMMEVLQRTGADIVVGSPYHPDGAVRGVPAWRLVLSRGAGRLYRLLLPVKLESYTACFRVFRGEAVARLRFDNPGFLGVTQMLVSAIEQGMTIVEYPTTLSNRLEGASKMKTLRVLRDHAGYLFHLWRKKSSPAPGERKAG